MQSFLAMSFLNLRYKCSLLFRRQCNIAGLMAGAISQNAGYISHLRM
jgi:hypothetical protein